MILDGSGLDTAGWGSTSVIRGTRYDYVHRAVGCAIWPSREVRWEHANVTQVSLNILVSRSTLPYRSISIA